MGLFSFKKKAVRKISMGVWGHLVNAHGFDVDTLANFIRCVEKDGVLDDNRSVTFLRIFNLRDAEKKGVEIKSWDTFDEHPDLILLEGYLTRTNEAFLSQKTIAD